MNCCQLEYMQQMMNMASEAPELRIPTYTGSGSYWENPMISTQMQIIIPTTEILFYPEQR